MGLELPFEPSDYDTEEIFFTFLGSIPDPTAMSDMRDGLVFSLSAIGEIMLNQVAIAADYYRIECCR